jgi:PAS domain S-box-containing protein
MTDPIRVLHVDDEPNLADMVATFLERHNDRFDIHTAASPDNGESVLTAQDIDCVVSDYEMPGRTGLDFLEDVRAEHPALPFILYTGKGSEAVASTAMSKGATDYLQKEQCTDHYELLANTIENAVSQFRAEQRAATMERRYQALFKQSESAIAWIEYVNEVPIIRDCNPAFRAMFCGSGAELLGEDLDEVVVPDTERASARALSQEVRAGQSVRRTLTRESVEGPRRMQVQVIPVSSSDDGAITNAFAIYADVNQSRLRQ